MNEIMTCKQALETFEIVNDLDLTFYDLIQSFPRLRLWVIIYESLSWKQFVYNDIENIDTCISNDKFYMQQQQWYQQRQIFGG